MKRMLLSGLVASVVMLVVGLVVGWLFGLIMPSLTAQYQNAGLFRPWSGDPLMWLYFIYPFVLGFALAWVWSKTRSLLKGKSIWQNGLRFGFGYWLVATIPGMLITYSTFPVSFAMIVSWTVVALAETVCAGFVYAKMNR